MAGKPVKKHGVTTRQLVAEVPAGCSLPDFEQKPVTMALAEGRNAILRAVVCGEPLPEVHWQSSKGQLSDSSKYQIVWAPGGREHALQINKLTGEDTDKYRCVAVNPYGEAVCSARLTVIEVGFRKKRKRNTEPQENLSKELLMDLRKMLRKRTPPPKKQMDPEQVWQLLMTADRKDYERLCLEYGIADFRGLLRKLEKMRRERQDRMAQYINAVSNAKHIKVTREGVAFFELDLDLKDPESNIYLYKDGEMVPYSSESHTKRSVRRLGRHYHFQIQDLWPEDAGIYQVRVEDAEVFSTELEASAIPPRVVVPLSEARCEEQGDAVFQCVLSNPCPAAAWHFKHRPLQPSDKYAVSVSPDGMTHRLVVKGARLSDMGPYSLDTGLHVSSAWLVVETGQDEGLPSASTDHHAQAPSEAEGSRSASRKQGGPREQGSPGDALEGAGLDSGRQRTAGLDGDGLGGHGYSLMGDEGAADAAWGPGQARKGFLEADGEAATLSGDSLLHREGGWDASLSGGPHPQGGDVGSGPGLTRGRQLAGGRDGGGDGHGGPAGAWGAGSPHPAVGGLGGSGEGQKHSGDSRGQPDRHSQGQLWGAQPGPGMGKGALPGSGLGRVGSGSEGEGMGQLLQVETPGGAWGSGAGLRGPGALEPPEGRGALSEAGRGPETWGPQGLGGDDHGGARGPWEPGQAPGQTPAGKDSHDPSLSGGRQLFLGRGGPEGSGQEAGDRSPGEPVGGGRGYTTSPGGPGGPGGWGREGQGAAGASGEAGEGRSLQGSEGGTAGWRGAGGAGREEAESPGLWDSTGARSGPGGGRGGVGGTQVSGRRGSGQGGEANSQGLVGPPGRGAQGSWGTQGGPDGSRGPGAMGSGPDFWNGTGGSREGGRGAETGGPVGSGRPEGSGSLKGEGPAPGAGSGDGSGALGKVGFPRGAGAPGEAASEDGGAYRDGSGGPGAVQPGNQEGRGPRGKGPGASAGLQSGYGGPNGGRVEEAGRRPETWDASQGGGEAGPGGRRGPDGGLGSPGTAAPGARGGLGASAAVEAVVGGHGGAEPRGLTGDGGGFRASGAKGAPGEGGSGGPGATEPGSLRAGGTASDGVGARGLGAGAGSWDESGCPKSQASNSGAGSDSQGSRGPGSGSGSGEGPQHIGGRRASGGGSRGLGPEGVGSGSKAGHRDGIGGVGGLGSGGEAGHRDGIGGVGGMGPGGEAGHRDGIGGVGGLGPGGEAGHRDGIGGVGGLGPGGEAGHRDGIGGVEGMGPGGEAGHRDGIGGVGGLGPGGEAGHRDGIGGVGGLGPGGEAGHRDGIGGVEGMGPGGEAGHRDGIGGVGGLGSAGEAGSRKDVGVPEGMGSGAQAGPQGGLGGSRAVGSDMKTGHRGGWGQSGEIRPEGEKGSGGGSGNLGVTGAPAAVGPEGGPRGRGAEGLGAGHGAPSEASYAGTSSKGGRGPGLVNGAGPGVGAADGQGSRAGPGASATSGTPVSAGDRGPLRGEGWSADHAGGVGASGCLDGRGAMEGEARAGAGALGSRQEGSFQKTGAGTADGGGAAGRGGPGPGGAEGSLLGGGRVAGASGTGTGGDLDRGGAPGQRGKSTSASADGPGVSRARAPGLGDQGLEGGPAGAGRQPTGSRVGDAAFDGTQEGPGGSRGRAGAAGLGEARGRQGLGVVESEGSGPRRRRSAGPRDWDGARNGLEGPVGCKDSGDGSGSLGGAGVQLGRGRRGERGPLEAEADGTRGLGALKEDEGAEESSRSDRRPGPRGSRSPTRAGAKARGAERRALDEARGRGEQPEGEDAAGHPGESPPEDAGSPLGSRRGGTEGRLDAARSSRSRPRPGAGGLSEEARGPVGHFSRGLADTEARLGEAAMLSCTLSRDLGPGAWFKDGVKLSAEDADGLAFEQEGLVRRLLIAHALGTHAGRYSFVAGDQKSEATLTVRDPPVIDPDVMERLKEPLVVKAGKPLTVKIAFQSRLPVQATWTKDGAAVDSGGGRGAQVALGDGFTRLCLPSAGRRDGGHYSVTLRSQGGCVQAGVALQVIDKPQPPQGPLEVQDCRGTGVCLCWRPPRDDGGRALERYVVERRQAGRSTWLQLGEPPADSPSFTDAQVEQGKKYAYRVRAVTSEGPGEALESEEVLVAPEACPGPPSAPAILSASSAGITLTWTAPRGPGSAHLLGYLVEKRKKGSNTWAAVTEQPVPERKWTVMDLRPDCQYEFRVTAVAPSGPGQPGPPSDGVFARDPMRPPGPVRDLQVTDTSHTSISLRWALPDPQDGDEAQGYVVELCASDSLEWSPCHPGTVPATTYTAKGLRPREGYFVRVTAVNEGGRSPPTALDVPVQAAPAAVSPRFLRDASSKDLLVVRVGDIIRVPVRFEAAPLPEVTWLKDGLPLTKRSVTSTQDGLTQLLVPVASLVDSGVYTVVLRGQQGEEAACTFVLRVAERPQAPGPLRLQENVPGTVTVEWEPSPDEARGVPLHYAVLARSAGHGPWREVADRLHNNRFTFLGVLPGHEYHFRVVAKTELGASEPSETGQAWCLPRQRDAAAVQAPGRREPERHQRPWFLVGLRPHLLPPGCECCMSCAVRGCPPPRVTWFRNGESLEGRPGAYSTDTLGVCSLVIPCVAPEDSGLYKAVAENALGQAVSMATLIVTEPSP